MILVKLPTGKVDKFSLPRINDMLSTGLLKGDELAWMVGQKEWIPVLALPGVSRSVNPPVVSQEQPAAVKGRGRPEEDQDHRDTPRGVGGWLVVFRIHLILSGITNVLQGSNILSSLHTNRFLASSAGWVAILAGFCSTAIGGYALCIAKTLDKTQGRKWTLQYLRIRLCVFICLAIAIATGLLTVSDSPFTGIMLYSFLPVGYETCYFITWWLYFTRSKRVRNTYTD